MAKIKLTKKAIVLITVFSVLLIGAGAGYLVWTVNNQSQQVAPQDSSAGGDGSGYPDCTNAQIVDCQDAATEDACAGSSTYSCTNIDPPCNGSVMCPDWARVQCCDGTWVIAKRGSEATACSNYGGYGDCDKGAQACWCESFEGCGDNCIFRDPYIQNKVDDKAKETCERYMAFCVFDGSKTKVEIRPAGECWNQRDICNNPVAENPCETNTCEAGGIQTPANNTSVDPGQVLRISGWAADTDQIDPNSIVVKVDGQTVGRATITGAAAGHTEPNAVAWSYNWTVDSTAGTRTINVSWKDKKGATGAKCTASRTIVVRGTSDNVCEFGGMQTPSANQTFHVGDTMHITGWAADPDGIDPNSIVVRVDGQTVGNANVTGDAAGHTEPNAVAWAYDWTVSGNEGGRTLNVSWRDTLGNTGTGCSVSRSFNVASNVVTITKTSSSSCNTDSTIATVSYLITLTNYTDQNATVRSVVDNLDSNMSVDWINRSSITPAGGVVTSDGIEWQLNNTTLAPGASLTFSYSVNVPSTAFGMYTNTVTAYLDPGSVSAYRNTNVGCNPDTGLFDSTTSKLVAGGLLVFLGFAYMYLDNERRYSIKLTEKGISLFTYSGQVNRTRQSFAERIRNRISKSK